MEMKIGLRSLDPPMISGLLSVILTVLFVTVAISGRLPQTVQSGSPQEPLVHG